LRPHSKVLRTDSNLDSRLVGRRIAPRFNRALHAEELEVGIVVGVANLLIVIIDLNCHLAGQPQLNY